MFKSFLFAILLGVVSIANAEETKAPTVYQELAESANVVLRAAIEKATTAGDFLEEQVPLVVKELIAWKIVGNLAFAFIMFFPSPFIFVGVRKHGFTQQETDWNNDLTTPGLLALFNALPFMLGLLGLFEGLKWVIAPRVALIEYAASLVK
jgi:hypothetical protein